jgi:hypothetical protein
MVPMPRPAPIPAGLALAACALLASACTPRVLVPESERLRARESLAGQGRYLRVAMTVHPLYGDVGKALLLDAPAAEVDLLRGGADEKLAPPPAERVLPPGTPVRILEVEFPTGLLIARRVVMTPRYHPWVLLAVRGEARPGVLVLSQDLATADDVASELDRVLSSDDPSPAFRALPADQHDAILRKELVEGMGVRAVEMAWGRPELRRIDRPSGTETWTWPGGKRKARFQDEKLVAFDR